MSSLKKIDFAEVIYRGEGNIRFEDEIILPDYCEDASRILRLELTPVIDKSRAFIQDNVLNVELSGRGEFCLLYIGDSGECQSYGFSQDFSQSFKKDIGKTSNIVSESIFLSVCPVSCTTYPKALSPRKILARAEVKTLIEAFANIECEVYNSLEDKASHKVEPMKKDMYVARVQGGKSERKSINQEIKLPSALPSCQKVLSCTATVNVDSIHPSSDSIAVFSTVNFNVSYVSESNSEPVSFYQPIEIRDVIECDDTAEDSICRIRAQVGKSVCTPVADNFGENRMFSLETSYTLNALVMENIEESFVTDLYGVGCIAESESESGRFSRFVGSLTESTPFRERLSINTQATKVCCVKGDCRIANVVIDKDASFVEAEIFVSLFGMGDDGVNSSVNESFRCKFPINIPDSVSGRCNMSEVTGDGTISLSFVNAQISNSGIEISGEIETHLQLWESESVKYVKSVSLSEAPLRQGKIVFYYPNEEDTLWSVGKRYGVEMDKIKEANQMEKEELPLVCRIP